MPALLSAHPAPLSAPLPFAPAAVPRVDLVLAGARGRVASALRRQLARRRAALLAQAGLDLRLLAAFDRHGFAFDLQGLHAAAADEDFDERSDGDLEGLVANLCQPDRGATLLVDCTASDEIADLYPRLLAAGVGVVGANKRANARSHAHWEALQRDARAHRAPYRYETTVGAAIPLLGPLRDLRLRGERVLSLEGVLSGSLSFVLHRVQAGADLSDAVAEAVALGYTEPDPLDDLRAVDLARKLLVLARESGFALEWSDLRVEPLVDPAAAGRLGLAAALRGEDVRWRERARAAAACGERWVVLAGVDAGGGWIGPRRVPADSPFASLPAGQNLVRIRTDLQDAAPLLLGGPGAGPEVTAAGLLSDIVAAARELAGTRDRG
jgi:homoserine dehydrogenase